MVTKKQVATHRAGFAVGRLSRAGVIVHHKYPAAQ